MHKRTFCSRCIAIAVIAFTMALTALVTVYAANKEAKEPKDYTISDASLRLNSDGSVWAGWEKSPSETSYRVQLQAMKNGKWVDVDKYINTRDVKYDFSSIIAAKGTAYYRISVYPLSGGPTKYRIYSADSSDEALAIDSASIVSVRAYADAQRKSGITAGWNRTSDGSWIYYDSSKNMVKNGWLRDNGHYFYLNDKGIMVKGWQAIEGRWYYLEPTGTAEHPEGSRWSGTTTPDGYKLDRNGARLKADGSVETTTENTVSSDGYVKVKMTKPANFFINKAGNLQWDNVENAAFYTIDVSMDGTRYFNLTVTSPVLRIYSGTNARSSTNRVYLDGLQPKNEDEKIEGTVTLQISACSEKVGNKYTKTKPVEIADLERFAWEHSYEGEFKNVGSKLCYENDAGERVTGWQEIGGYWYHFDDSGYASGPGWFEDTTGYTYYFDERHRMVTGERTIDNVKCSFNDGSDTTRPLGALMK